MDNQAPANPNGSSFLRCSRVFAAITVAAGLSAASALSALIPGESSVITGHLLGHDGRPMVKAQVHLVRPPGEKPLKTVEVSSGGAFRLETKETGALLLVFTGVSHHQKNVPLVIGKPVREHLEVRLKTYDYLEKFDGVKMIGSFNDFKMRSGVEGARQPDGTYTFQVETRSPTVAYELMGIEKSGRAVNGTQSDGFEYDGAGDYQSVVRVKGGKATIRFDPKRLVRSSAPAQARFGDPESVEAGFLSIFEDSEAREQTYFETVDRIREEGKSVESLRLDWSSEEAALSSRLQKEKNPLLQEALRLSVLDLASCGGSLSPESIRSAIAGVSPRSLLWSYYPALIAVVVDSSPAPDSPDGRPPGASGPTSDPVEEIVSGRPEQDVKSLMLFLAGFKARSLRQNDRANRYYQRLVSEFPDSSQAKAALGLGPQSKIAVGKAVPSFSFPALDEPSTVYTPETLQGKIYLLDFWATWCGPCVGEQATLHKAYEKYKGHGFEIVSLSFDGRPEDVGKFRRGKWRMPWLHTFVTGGFGSEMAKTFEVGVIPKPILVDRHGIIIATYEELRGAALEETLERALGQKK